MNTSINQRLSVLAAPHSSQHQSCRRQSNPQTLADGAGLSMRCGYCVLLMPLPYKYAFLCQCVLGGQFMGDHQSVSGAVHTSTGSNRPTRAGACDRVDDPQQGVHRPTVHDRGGLTSLRFSPQVSIAPNSNRIHLLSASTFSNQQSQSRR